MEKRHNQDLEDKFKKPVIVIKIKRSKLEWQVTCIENKTLKK